MGVPWGAIIGGGALLGSAIIGASSQHRQNERDRAFQQKLMNFQGEMANTQYQRKVKDLRAAGLSPTLAAGGSGAMPAIPGQQNQEAPGKHIARGISETAQMALNIAATKQNISQSKSQEALTDMKLDETKYNLDWFRKNNLPTNQSLPIGLKYFNTAPGVINTLTNPNKSNPFNIFQNYIDAQNRLKKSKERAAKQAALKRKREDNKDNKKQVKDKEDWYNKNLK
jgi:hypothetical protein